MVGVHDPAIDGLVKGDDGVVALIDQFHPVDRLTIFQVRLTFRLHHISWNSEADLAIDTSALGSAFGHRAFVVIVQGRHFVSEKAGCFASGVGDQGFGFREVKPQLFPKECPNGCFNLLSFRFCPSEAEQKVVGVTTLAQAAKGGISGIERGELLELLSQFFCFFALPAFVQIVSAPNQSSIGGVDPSFATAGILRDEGFYDVVVQFVKQNSGKDGAEHRALRHA